MKAIERLREQLKQIGATLDDRSNEHALNCDAPPGYIWSANGEPNYVIHFATNRESWLVEALKLETPALKMGLRKVNDPDRLAQIQYNLDDDAWTAPADAPERIEWTSK